MDVHVPAAITRGLRLRGVDVLTSQEDETADWGDVRLLNRAGELGRVIFTCDGDFLIEAAERLASGADFATVVFARIRDLTISAAIEDLTLLATGLHDTENRGLVIYLPL